MVVDGKVTQKYLPNLCIPNSCCTCVWFFPHCIYKFKSTALKIAVWSLWYYDPSNINIKVHIVQTDLWFTSITNRFHLDHSMESIGIAESREISDFVLLIFRYNNILPFPCIETVNRLRKQEKIYVTSFVFRRTCVTTR